jgi:hypothetical protein
MNVDDGVASPVDLARGGEDALVVRPRAEVEVRRLPAGGVEFVSALTEGLSLMAAAEAAATADAGFVLVDNLTGLIQSEVLVDYSSAEL